MIKAMTIEEFHALVSKEPKEDDSSLLTALRELKDIEKPEDIIALAVEGPLWGTWSAV